MTLLKLSLACACLFTCYDLYEGSVCRLDCCYLLTRILTVSVSCICMAVWLAPCSTVLYCTYCDILLLKRIVELIVLCTHHHEYLAMLLISVRMPITKLAVKVSILVVRLATMYCCTSYSLHHLAISSLFHQFSGRNVHVGVVWLLHFISRYTYHCTYTWNNTAYCWWFTAVAR